MRLDELNRLPEKDAVAELLRCCGANRWALGMARARPFADLRALLAAGDRVWGEMKEADWREAFAHHPRIGDVSALRAKFAATSAWASQEQKGAAEASEATLQVLAQGNRDYEARFGHIFLVCATGKTADEMLSLLRARMSNTPADELRVAAGEQAKITRLRLEKLLS